MMRPALALCVVALAAVACVEPPETEPVARGRQLYRQLDCARCHLVEGQGGRLGPELTHIATVAEARRPGTSAEAYIRESLEDPGAYVVPGYNDVMPRGLVRRLPESDVDALVRYLLTLK